MKLFINLPNEHIKVKRFLGLGFRVDVEWRGEMAREGYG